MDNNLQKTQKLIDAMQRFNQTQLQRNEVVSQVETENKNVYNGTDLGNVLKVISLYPADATEILGIIIDTMFMPQAENKKELALIYRIVVSKIVETIGDDQQVRILVDFATSVLNESKEIMVA